MCRKFPPLGLGGGCQQPHYTNDVLENAQN